MRTRNDRPRNPARWGEFSRLLRLLMLGDFPEFVQVQEDGSSTHKVIPIIANGDFFTHRQMESFQGIMKAGPLSQ